MDTVRVRSRVLVENESVVCLHRGIQGLASSLTELFHTDLCPPLPLECRDQTPDQRTFLLGAFMRSIGLTEEILLRIVVFCDVCKNVNGETQCHDDWY